MNKLCISKLLQVIGEDMIPNERTGTESTAPAPRLSQGTTPPAGQAFTRTPQSHAAPAATGGSSFGQSYQPQNPPFKPAQARV
jgi:hypothetical protein